MAMTVCTIYFVYYFGILASQIRGIGINETIEKRRNAFIYPIMAAWRLISPVAAPRPSVELISKFPIAQGMANTFANSDRGMPNSTLLIKVDWMTTATDMDMNKDDPKLRSIWNTAVASSRYAGLTVENIIKVNGTQVKPIPTPCKTPVQATPK